MNIRELKIGITIALMNLKSGDYLEKIKELMSEFSNQIGNLNQLSVLNQMSLGNDHSLKTFSFQYDHCILNVDIVTHTTTNIQYINHFDLA